MSKKKKGQKITKYIVIHCLILTYSVIKNISNYHLIIQEDDNEDDMSIEDEEPTPIDNDDSEEESKASTESDDPFNWLWMPICDCPVHVSVACVQVSKETTYSTSCIYLKEGEVYEYTLYAEENEICPFTSSITIPGK